LTYISYFDIIIIYKVSDSEKEFKMWTIKELAATVAVWTANIYFWVLG